MPPSPHIGILDRVNGALRAFTTRWGTPSRRIRWHCPPPEYLLFAAGVVALVMAFDEPVARFAIALPKPIIAVAKTITDFGTSLYMFVIAATVAVAAILARGRSRDRRVDAGLGAIAERATYVFATVALAGITAQIVKHILGRARPRFIDTLGAHHFELIAFAANRNSFPSGHSANAFAAALALGIVWPRARPWLLGAAVTVALSRIAVRAHYPSDALVGAMLGCACALAAGTIFARRGLALHQTAAGLVPRGRRAAHAALRLLRRGSGTTTTP